MLCSSVPKHHKDITDHSLTTISGATLLGGPHIPGVLLHGAGYDFVPFAGSAPAHRARLSPSSLFVMTHSDSSYNTLSEPELSNSIC